MKRIAVVGALAAGLLAAGAPAADAHPLGNFTVNRYAGLRIQPDKLLVRYVVDMAEIPAFQERGKIDTNGDHRVDTAEAAAYRARTCGRIGRGLDVRLDGRTVSLQTQGSALAFPAGAAGLGTLRLECDLSGAIEQTAAPHDLRYADANFAGRVGWREITAIGDRSTLVASSVPERSISEELARYPEDLLRSPPDVGEATIRFRPGGPAAAPKTQTAAAQSFLPRGVDGATRAFTSFLARRTLTVPLAALALLLAIGLGALHALAPGHGKSVMAASLVGQRGSLRQGVLIGLTVTATHTAGVLVLGLLLSASATIAPERLYPILGIASGALLAGVGGSLLRRAVRARRSSHTHDHTHSDSGRLMSTRNLLGLGFAGGLVPSPSAVVVLLGATALGRAWFGVVLVVAYGLGMAVTLSGAGLLLVKMRAVMERRGERRPAGGWLRGLARGLPVVTASVVVGVGLMLAARGLTQI